MPSPPRSSDSRSPRPTAQASRCFCYRDDCDRCIERAARHVIEHRFTPEQGDVAEFLANDDEVAREVGEIFADLSSTDLDRIQRAVPAVIGRLGTVLQRFNRSILEGIEHGTLAHQQLERWRKEAEASRDEDADRARLERKGGEPGEAA